MVEQINTIKKEFESRINERTQSSSDIDLLRKEYLGKDSDLMAIIADLRNLSPEVKKDVGRASNDLKEYITNILDELAKSAGVQKKKIAKEIDVTLPGKKKYIGKLHPHTRVLREMNEIFKQLGFSVYSGPEIETDEYVFERLNLPKNHPARSLQDTLVIEDPEIILRSHTSSVEIRAMENEKLPIRIVVPGRVYRYEDLNQTNHFAFFQYEGLAVGEDITMADLKGTFESFARSFFGPETKIRIRAKYYPQVEPGCGLDIMCTFCHGEGCPVCKKRGWLEASGGGMVHPNALRSCGIDPEKYSGFAWGMGFDRIVMQKYGITDIRKLFDGTLY